MSISTRQWLIVSGLVLAGQLPVTPAVAQGGSNMAAAEALFREGRVLLKQGKVAAACRKLAESQRLDPSPGTMLNLAGCHETQGKTASAWAEYLEAARMARANNRERLASTAKKKADELAPKLSHMTLSVKEPPPGFTIERNGQVVKAPEFGSKIPIDPDSYELVASAPGRESWTMKVTVDPGADHQIVTVPALKKSGKSVAAPIPDADPKPAARETPKPTEPARTPEEEPSLILPYVIGGVGIVFAGVGAVFGSQALGDYSDAEKGCNSDHTGCSPEAMSLRSDASDKALFANIGIGVGAAAMVTSLVLILTSRGGSEVATKDSALQLRVAPVKRGGAAFVGGRF